MGGDKKNPNVIEVIEIACDECPVSGHVVTESCRGCLAHRCEDVCRRGAITFDEQQKAHIDKSKCVECGQCAKVCPYSAIINQKRPCEKACKIKAISMSSEEHRAAHIDNEKCISCGACVYQCRSAQSSISPSFSMLSTLSRQPRKSGLQGLRGRSTVYLQPVQLCKARSGYHRHPAPRLLSCHRGGARRRYGCV